MGRNGFTGKLGGGALLLAVLMAWCSCALGGTLYWSGDSKDDAGKSWNTGNGNFWLNSPSSGTVSPSITGATVIFDATGQGNPNVYVGNLGAKTPQDVSIAGMTVTSDYTFDGGAINLSSSGTLNITSGAVHFENAVNNTSSGRSLTVGGTGTTATATFDKRFAFTNGVTINDGSTLYLNFGINDTAANDTKFLGQGTVQLGNTANTLFHMSSINDTFAGTIKAISYSQLHLDAAASLTNATVNLDGANTQLVLGASIGSDNATTVGTVVGTGLINLGNTPGNTLILLATAKGTDTFTGAVGGYGNLTIGNSAKAGTVELKAANTYAGKTTIANGTLKLSDSGSIAASSGLDISTNGTFDISDKNAVENIKSLNGSGKVILGDNRLNFTDNDGTLGSYSGIISGTGGISINADNAGDTLTLTGVNSYTGETKIVTGTLSLGKGSAIAASANVAIGNDGTLTLGQDATIKSLTSSASGSKVQLNDYTLTLNGKGVSGEFAGNISGDGGVTLDFENGTDSLTLSGVNKYTGKTTVESGRLKLDAIDGIAASSELALTGANTVVELAANQTFQKVNSTQASSTLDIDSGNMTIGGTDAIGSLGSFAGVITGTSNVSILGRDGSAAFTLSGANTYTGKTNIEGASLILGDDASLASKNISVKDGSLVLGDNATIASANKVTIDDNSRLELEDAGTGAAATVVSGLTGDGGVVLGTNRMLNLIGDSTDYTGLISGDGGVQIGNEDDDGTVTFAQGHDYEGVTSVVNGMLTLAVADALGNSSGLVLGEEDSTNKVRLVLNVDQTLKTLTGYEKSAVNLKGNTLTISEGGDFAGVISSSGDLIGSLHVTGDTLTLRGENTYTGTTTIENGTLALAGEGSIKDKSEVQFGDSGVLNISEADAGMSIVAIMLDDDATDAGIVTASGKTLTLAGNSEFSGDISGDGNVTAGSGENNESVILTGVTSYTGTTTIAQKGSLTLSGDGSIAKSAGLNMEGTSTAASSFTVNKDGGTAESPVITELKALSGTADSDVVIHEGNTLALAGSKDDSFTGGYGSFSGEISGDGGLIIGSEDSEKGTFTFKGTAEYTGDTILENATLALDGANLNSGSAMIIREGGVLDLSNADDNQTFAKQLTGESGAKIELGDNELFIKNGKINEFSGSIEGSKYLHIQGNSTLHLAVGTTSVAITNINDTSTLSLTSKAELASNVNVGNGATLTADGGTTIRGNVSINTGGTFSTDDSGGTLEMTTNFTTQSDSQLFFAVSNGSQAAINVSEKVTLHANTVLEVAAASSRNSYTLISAGSFDNTLSSALDTINTTFTITTSSGSSDVQGFLRVEGNNIVVTLYDESKINQNWVGGDGTWGKGHANWTDSYGSGNKEWYNQPGGVANFGSGGGTVAVAGRQDFDTLNFDGDYTFTGKTNNDVLAFVPGGTNTNAPSIINLGGNEVTIDTRISGVTKTGRNLDIVGGGRLVLTNGANTWGKTFIDGSGTASNGTTLELQHADAAGAGDITLAGSESVLELNFNNGTFANKITGSGGAVVIAEGKNVIFGVGSGNENDYSAVTVIQDGASLTSTNNSTGDLSENSVHQLEGDGNLVVVGQQTIAGLASGTDAEDASVTIGGGYSLSLSGGGDYVYSGGLSGSGNLVMEGTGTQTINNFGYGSNFAGTVSATDGTLALWGAEGRDMDLRLGSSGVSSKGLITVNAGGLVSISGSNYFGELEIQQGMVVLGENGDFDALRVTDLILADGIAMDVTGDDSGGVYEIGSLTLDGNNTIVLNTTDSGTLSSITIMDDNGLDVNGSGNSLIIDAGLLGDVDGRSFFDLLGNTGKTYLIRGDDLYAGSLEVVDVSGTELDGVVDSAIIQGGVQVGVATIDSNIDTDSTGIYLEQALTKIASNSNVTIDSSASAASGFTPLIGGRSLPGTYKDMSAELTGNGFTFTGDENILVSNAKNSYTGSTIVSMLDDKSVSMGSNSAFGKSAVMDVQSGEVNLNNYSLTLNTLTGTESSVLNMGDANKGGTLTLRNPTVTDNNLFAGNVLGTGRIVKTGAGEQLFTGANNLTGSIDVTGGRLGWAGNLGQTGKAGAVNVAAGSEFSQLGSHITGAVTVSGVDAKLSGYGDITGNLNIVNGGSYIVSAESGGIDKTTVSGKTTFGSGSSVSFNTEALSYMYMNPYQKLDILQSGSFDLTNSAWKNGVIMVDMGILGTANLRVDGNTLSYTDLTAPVGGIGDIISSSWGATGVNVSDIMKQSNLGDIVSNTVNRFLGADRYQLDASPVLNARFANAKFMGMGPGAIGDIRFSRDEALSLFNHESGLGATQIVDAMTDTNRFMLARGLTNRVHSLRAGRAIIDANYTPARSGTAYGDLTVPDPGQSSNRIWASGLGTWSKYDTSDGGIAGYSYDAYGIMVGADRAVGDLVFGGALAYTHGTLEDNLALGSSSKLDSYSANLFADYNHFSGINVMGNAGFQWFDAEDSRTVAGFRDIAGVLSSDYGSVRADYSGLGWYAGVNASYDILPLDNLTLTPSLGLTYSNVQTDGFDRITRRNSGVVLTDRFDRLRRHSIQLPVDITATYDFIVERDRKLSALANIGYAFEFNNKAAGGRYAWAEDGTAPAVSFSGREPGRSTWMLGLGARFQKENFDFDLKYDYLTQSDLSNHRLSVTVGLEF